MIDFYDFSLLIRDQQWTDYSSDILAFPTFLLSAQSSRHQVNSGENMVLLPRWVWFSMNRCRISSCSSSLSLLFLLSTHSVSISSNCTSFLKGKTFPSPWPVRNPPYLFYKNTPAESKVQVRLLASKDL